MSEHLVLLSKEELAAIIERTAQAVANDLRADLQNSQTREIMSKSQLADYWSCSTVTINRYMNAGMPYIRNGDKEHPRFSLTAVNNWRERFKKIQGQKDNRQRSQLV